MKKLLAILLALGLVLVSFAALAEGDQEVPVEEIPVLNEKDVEVILAKTAGSPTPVITKTYTTTGTASDVYPIETLKFTVTKGAENYPDITVGYDGTEDGKAANTYTTAGAKTYDIPVNVPAVSAYKELGAGMYHYTVTETTPDAPSQSAEYNTESTTFNVDVYVTYVKDTTTNQYTKDLEETIVVYSGEAKTTGIAEANKQADFKNTYAVGSLKVTKEITGNLSDPNKAFTIKVTLTSDKRVANDITVTNNATTCETTEIDAGWGAGDTKEVVFTAKGGEYITINNIPAGVKYKIEETSVTSDDRIEPDNATNQMAKVNNDNAYAVTGEVTTATAITAEAVEKTITNNKTIEVPTGITLDFVPYVMIIALAGIALVALKARKKEN